MRLCGCVRAGHGRREYTSGIQDMFHVKCGNEIYMAR